MPLLRERATDAIAKAAAQRMVAALAGIPESAGRSHGTTAAPASARATARPASVRSSSSETVVIDDQAIPVPPEVHDAVLDLLHRFAAGESVVVGSTDSLLTTSQAAQLLGISATYLLRLANEGTIAVEYRGTHRRFRLADAMEYLEKSRVAKAARAAKLDTASKSESAASQGEASGPAGEGTRR